MEISYCPGCRTDELFSYYPFLHNVDVYVADDDFFNKAGLSNALAVTDRDHTIIVRQNLPYPLFRHALFHECEHFVQNYDAPEYLVESEARKKDGFSYSLSTYADFKNSLKPKVKFNYSINTWSNSSKTSKRENGLPAYLKF